MFARTWEMALFGVQVGPRKPGEPPKGLDQVVQSFNMAIQIEALELFLLLVLLILLLSDTVCLVKALRHNVAEDRDRSAPLSCESC